MWKHICYDSRTTIVRLSHHRIKRMDSGRSNGTFGGAAATRRCLAFFANVVYYVCIVTSSIQALKWDEKICADSTDSFLTSYNVSKTSRDVPRRWSCCDLRWWKFELNPLNLILSKFCWCIVWEVETAKFLHFNIVGKLTSRALNPYQFCCHAMFQIWVITQETTWSTENLPYSRVLEKTESQIWHDSALYSDYGKPITHGNCSEQSASWG